MAGVGDVVEEPDRLFRVPRVRDLGFGVPGTKKALKSLLAFNGHAFFGEQHELAAFVERVALAAAMTERFVLDPSPALIQPAIGELDHVKRISDLAGVGQGRVEHGFVGA